MYVMLCVCVCVLCMRRLLEELNFLTSQLDAEEAQTVESHIQFLVQIKLKISFLHKTTALTFM